MLHGIDKQKLEDIWVQMREFGRYAFNKSHAICYADIAFKTAYLKANYPSEYMASLISCEGSPEQQSIYMSDAKRNGIDVMPPDMNSSDTDFAIGSGGEILFGFRQVKGLGDRVVKKILSIQPFDSFADFLIKSYHAKGINKRAIEVLINCGACDTFGYLRSGMVSSFEKFLTDYSQHMSKDMDKKSLNEINRGFIANQDTYFNVDMAEYPITKILEFEKTLLGVHISGDPFEIFQTLVSEKVQNIKYLEENPSGSHYILCQINKIKRLQTKKKKEPMAFIEVSDISGASTSCVIFPNQFAKCGSLIEENRYILAFVNVKEDDRGISFQVARIRDLSSEIDSVSCKIEAEKQIPSIDINVSGEVGTVRMKSLCSKISEFTTEEATECVANLTHEVSSTKFLIKKYNVKKIDIAMLRAFSKFTFANVGRTI